MSVPTRNVPSVAIVAFGPGGAATWVLEGVASVDGPVGWAAGEVTVTVTGAVDLLPEHPAVDAVIMNIADATAPTNTTSRLIAV